MDPHETPFVLPQDVPPLLQDAEESLYRVIENASGVRRNMQKILHLIARCIDIIEDLKCSISPPPSTFEEMMTNIESVEKLEILLIKFDGAVTREALLPTSLNHEMMETWESSRKEFYELLKEILNTWAKDVEQVSRLDDYLWVSSIAQDMRGRGIDGAQRAERIAASLLEGDQVPSSLNRDIEAVMNDWKMMAGLSSLRLSKSKDRSSQDSSSAKYEGKDTVDPQESEPSPGSSRSPIVTSPLDDSIQRSNSPDGRRPAPRRPPRPGIPADAAERWIRELENETGAISVTRAAASVTGVDLNSDDTLRRRDRGEGRGRLLPDFWVGSYESALKTAQKDAKPMCVILTCDERNDVDTAEFKRSVLADTDLARVLTDNDFIVWGGDVRDNEAHQTSLKLSATTFPFVAFIALHPLSEIRTESGPSSPPQLELCVLSRHEGSPTSVTSATTLHNHITKSLLPRVTPILTRVKNEIRLRKQEQELIAQQDRAYKEPERRYWEKLERRQVEERRKQEGEAELPRLEREKISKAEQGESWRLWKRHTLPAEPAASEKAIRIIVRMPNGERLTKRFRPSESVEDLYAAVDVGFLSCGEDAAAPSIAPVGYTHEYEFCLATLYPRKEIELSSETLGSVDVLKGGGDLVVEMKAGLGL
ncbi:hypothetical protein FRC04_006161 [Tulasnella sp. 424]|nr:hypothetical protein FRC04_006161 [Tulasnella sp. 424]